MASMITALASLLSFLAYLIENNSIESIGFDWLRFSKPAQRQGPAPRVSAPDFRISSFEFRFSILDLPQFGNRAEKKRTSFSDQPLSIPNIIKGSTLNISFAQKWLIL